MPEAAARALASGWAVGRTYRARCTIDADMVSRFADFSGDHNPLHVDAAEAQAYGYARPMAHGAILTALVSKAIGTEVPGPGAVWMSQSIEWLRPVFVGDTVELTITVRHLSTGAGVGLLDLVVTNQEGRAVMQGEAKVKLAERVAERRDASLATGGVALVTGGSGGMGAAIAERLSAAGLRLAIGYHHSQETADRVAETIRSSGGTAETFRADLGDPRAASTLVEQVIQAFGRLDVVVHCATPPPALKPIKDLTYQEFDVLFSVYVGAALALVQAAVPGMAERKFGRFIFLGTAATLGAPPAKWAAYLVPKYALWGFTRCLAMELGPLGITSNMVAPGVTVTPLTADLPARARELEAATNPMRRLATPQDTAEAVAFLASEGAGYINGAHLPVTGGATVVGRGSH